MISGLAGDDNVSNSSYNTSSLVIRRMSMMQKKIELVKERPDRSLLNIHMQKSTPLQMMRNPP